MQTLEKLLNQALGIVKIIHDEQRNIKSWQKDVQNFERKDLIERMDKRIKELKNLIICSEESIKYNTKKLIQIKDKISVTNFGLDTENQ